MTLLATILNPATGQMILALLLAACGFVFLLPQPRGRSVSGGVAALLASLVVFIVWAQESFGKPMPDFIGTALFYFFSCGALGFGCVVVTQKNPARGAIAFAFVVLSTCGLFLLLAAPFLMAVTVIVYAGAIVVTFLFVLMLSHQDGPSDENDRSREPLLGSLAGFAFAGLVLFALHQSQLRAADTESLILPAQVITPEERDHLNNIAIRLNTIENDLDGEKKLTNLELANSLTSVESDLEHIVGISPAKQEGFTHEGSIISRLQIRVSSSQPDRKNEADPQAISVIARTQALRELANTTFRMLENQPPLASSQNRDASITALNTLRDEVRLLASAGELPARNVSNIGFVMYSEYLLAVELAGTLLLVATIGAIAIAHRRGVRA